MGRIAAQSSLCTGCRLCEMVCSVDKTGQFSARSSRIWIETDALVGKDIPHVCQQNIKACRDKGNDQPRCIAACPAAAEVNPPIYWDDVHTMVRFNIREGCSGCLACLEACRFQAIRIDPLIGQPVKCELCGGDPQCTKLCVVNAISYDQEQKADGQKADTIDKNI